MSEEIKLTERYERNGWPSLPRPDLKPPEGWDQSLLISINRIYNHGLSPDGSRIAFIWNRDEFSDIYIMPVEGGWPERLTFERRARQYWWDDIPRWSPDGKWLAYDSERHVYVVATSGGLPRKITDFASRATTAHWLPDSHGLILSVEHEESEKILLTDKLGSWPYELAAGPGDNRDPEPSPDGKLVAYVQRPFNDLNRLDIQIVDVSNSQSRLIAGTAKQKNFSPRWSHSGRLLAFLSDRSGFDEIYLTPLEEGTIQQITSAKVDFTEIVWSPDDCFIAATANHDGAYMLVIVNVESKKVRYLKRKQGIFSNPQWSPRGDFITVEFLSSVQPPDIYRVKLNPESEGEVPDEDMVQLTFSTPPALKKLRMVTPDRVRFKSFDGQEIPCLLYKPIKPNGAAIVAPHGGPRDQALFDWDIFTQYLIAKGYTFLEVDYRGSTGYGRAYELLNQNDWGKGDTQDCLYAANYLDTLRWVDKERLSIMGMSYGGYLTICTLARDPEHRFACGVAIYGDADVYSSWALCERDTRLYTEMQIGHPARNRKAYLDGSPIHQVKQIQKPLLILHGLEDDIVPPYASEELVESLRKADKTFEYKTYSKESHGFMRRDSVVDRYSRIERYLDWYLMPYRGD